MRKRDNRNVTRSEGRYKRMQRIIFSFGDFSHSPVKPGLLELIRCFITDEEVK
uniref:Uncharacterized protein n=1 Tax=Arundo donax TaxID=35708 RepID=A0A0A9BRU5_ARUDO